MICESLRIWNDPNCERTANATEGIDWDVTRREFSHTMPLTSVQIVSFRNNPMPCLLPRYQLLQIPFPESMAVIGPVVTRLENPFELDNAEAWTQPWI
jgi:hypothetical protein